MTKCGGHARTDTPPKVHWGCFNFHTPLGMGDLRLQYNLFVVKYNFACFQIFVFFLVVKHNFLTIQFACCQIQFFDNKICLLSNTILFVVKHNFLTIQFACCQIQFCLSSNTIF
jgi:hypothetical protein